MPRTSLQSSCIYNTYFSLKKEYEFTAILVQIIPVQTRYYITCIIDCVMAPFSSS
jgi:hypothetical protein